MTILVTEDLDEAAGLKFTKKDKSSWEKQAKTMGLVIKPATDSEGESDKMWNAKDKQGNTKGKFHVDKGGFLKEDLDESTSNEINEAEDRYKFLNDLIFEFEKKLMLFAPLYKELDPEVVKDIKSLEKECERVRKGRLYKIR